MAQVLYKSSRFCALFLSYTLVAALAKIEVPQVPVVGGDTKAESEQLLKVFIDRTAIANQDYQEGEKFVLPKAGAEKKSSLVPYANPASVLCLTVRNGLKHARTQGFGASCKQATFFHCIKFLQSPKCPSLLNHEARDLFGMTETKPATRTVWDLKKSTMRSFGMVDTCTAADLTTEGLCAEAFQALSPANYTNLLRDAIGDMEEVPLQIPAAVLEMGYLNSLRATVDVGPRRRKQDWILPEDSSPTAVNSGVLLAALVLAGLVGIYCVVLYFRRIEGATLGVWATNSGSKLGIGQGIRFLSPGTSFFPTISQLVSRPGGVKPTDPTRNKLDELRSKLHNISVIQRS